MKIDIENKVVIVDDNVMIGEIIKMLDTNLKDDWKSYKIVTVKNNLSLLDLPNTVCHQSLYRLRFHNKFLPVL